LSSQRELIWRQCAELGLPINENLPALESCLLLRSKQEIAYRSMALLGVVAGSYGFSAEKVKKWIEANALTNFLTHEESLALSGGKDLRPFQWGVHSLYALAWVLGYTKNFSVISEVPDQLVHIFPDIKKQESGDAFVESASLRSTKEVALELDRAYCVHWAIVESGLRGIKPKYEGVPERRLALEWCLSDLPWADISLDT
jgi:hypothetical protein